MHFGMYLKKITPLKGPFKCDIPRCGYHGGGVYGSVQINVMKVYGANVALQGVGAVNFPEKGRVRAGTK